ncbi:MAG: peptidoglycan bridge formation glycyltransferase FemA/FemB family protein [Bacteroidota bacterium]
MKIYSYTDKSNRSPENIFSIDSPLQFQKGFSVFYQKYFNNEVKILHSERFNAFIPIRYFKLKVFHFAQILHAPVCNNVELDAETQQLFFEDLVEYHIKHELCQRFIQPHPYGILKAVPRGAQSCPFGTYINHLDKMNDEELLFSFDPKYRKSVNHAEKNGAVTRFGRDQFDVFYQLYKQTTERAGIHCDTVAYFDALYKHLGEEYIEVGVVYDQDQPIGGIFLLNTNYSALCTHAGSGGESKLYGGMKMLHYQMMLRLKKRGVRLYDLVGVRINSNNESLEGIFRFKKGFGGDLKEGYLWKMDIAPVKSRVFDMMMKLRYRSNATRDIIDEESN